MWMSRASAPPRSVGGHSVNEIIPAAWNRRSAPSIEPFWNCDCSASDRRESSMAPRGTLIDREPMSI